jgi:hypothetical protein
MDVVVSLITGVFSLLTAIASIYLKDHLERCRTADKKPAATELKKESPKTTVAVAPTVSVSRVNWWRPVALTCGCWVIGNIGRALSDMLSFNGLHVEALASLILLTLIAVALVIYHSRTVNGFAFLTYQLEAFAIWAGYSSGWSMVHGSAWENMIRVNLAGWLACAVVGGFVFVVLRRIWPPASSLAAA